MNDKLMMGDEVQALLDKVAGLSEPDGNPRLKEIIRRLVGDVFLLIEDFDIHPSEFWHALHFLQQAAPEFGLIAPGLGFDRFLDIRSDDFDVRRGATGGTPRTIEGPLYVEGAPMSDRQARLDDGTDDGDVLVMEGRVVDDGGAPIGGAVVDVWHANTKGGYSYFDPSQAPYNNRRRIRTGSDGRYSFRTIVPKGYAVPPGGSTDSLLHAIGRHGRRPAHIHFFVSAANHRQLTTQINIDGDPDLHDDFAYATREGLVPPITRREADRPGCGVTVGGPHFAIDFDFVLLPTSDVAATHVSSRPRVPALA